jgi:hypothetical protein
MLPSELPCVYISKATHSSLRPASDAPHWSDSETQIPSVPWLGYKLHITETCDDAPACACPPAAAGSAARPARGHDGDCPRLTAPNLITPASSMASLVPGAPPAAAVRPARPARPARPGLIRAFALLAAPRVSGSMIVCEKRVYSAFSAHNHGDDGEAGRGTAPGPVHPGVKVTTGATETIRQPAPAAGGVRRRPPSLASPMACSARTAAMTRAAPARWFPAALTRPPAGSAPRSRNASNMPQTEINHQGPVGAVDVGRGGRAGSGCYIMLERIASSRAASA